MKKNCSNYRVHGIQIDRLNPTVSMQKLGLKNMHSYHFLCFIISITRSIFELGVVTLDLIGGMCSPTVGGGGVIFYN